MVSVCFAIVRVFLLSIHCVALSSFLFSRLQWSPSAPRHELRKRTLQHHNSCAGIRSSEKEEGSIEKGEERTVKRKDGRKKGPERSETS